VFIPLKPSVKKAKGALGGRYSTDLKLRHVLRAIGYDEAGKAI
jgi:hypothetical protein